MEPEPEIIESVSDKLNAESEREREAVKEALEQAFEMRAIKYGTYLDKVTIGIGIALGNRLFSDLDLEKDNSSESKEVCHED